MGSSETRDGTATSKEAEHAVRTTGEAKGRTRNTARRGNNISRGKTEPV